MLCRCPFCRSRDVGVSPIPGARVLCNSCGAIGPRDNSPHDTASELWNDQAGIWPHIGRAVLCGAVAVLLCLTAQHFGVLP